MSEARIIRIAAVLERTGISRTGLYRLVRRERFPRAVQLTPHTVGWHASEVDEWIDSRERTTGGRSA